MRGLQMNSIIKICATFLIAMLSIIFLSCNSPNNDISTSNLQEANASENELAPIVNNYIEDEQKDTHFDLSKKIHSQHIEPKNDIVVGFDAQKLTPQNFQILVNLSDMLQDSGEVGEMEYDIFKFYIKSLKTYEKELIVCAH